LASDNVHGRSYTYQTKIGDCEEQTALVIAELPNRVDPNLRHLPPRKAGRKPSLDRIAGQDMRTPLYQKFGVDLTLIEGIGVLTGLVLLTEVGPELSRFRTEKHFTAGLGLWPDNRISGGKLLSSRTRRVVNRAADALRMAASTLEKSQRAPGGYFRRMNARLSAAEAVTATAHKLARNICRLIKHGESYVRQGINEYEKRFRARKLSALQKTAKRLGSQLVPKQPLPTGVS
jgi:hypothetical protein